MNRSIRQVVPALFALLLVACDKPSEQKPEEPKATTTAATAVGTAPAATATTAAAPVVIHDSDLATPADFEEAAESSITAKSYKTDLAALEKDIAMN